MTTLPFTRQTTPRGPVTLLQAATAADVDQLAIDQGLTSIVRNPELLRTLLRGLTLNPRARLVLAVHDGTIVGRSVLAPSFGRWHDLPGVREFALEVARGWRGAGLAGALIRAALADPAAESELLLAFLLPTAWDAEHEGLTGAAYRTRLTDLLHRYGFRAAATDEPEVRFQQNAALLVRRGARVTEATLAAFEGARYQDRHARLPLMPAA